MLSFSRLQRRQVATFVLTWVAYASTYLVRKPLGVIKTDLASELSLTKTQLGWLDTSMLLPYATMQMILGPLADKFGARSTLAWCLFLSAASVVGFGTWIDVFLLMIMLFFNGVAQAQTWPCCVKALGSWYPDRQRNAIFGIWGTCTFAGGIMGTGLAVHIQRMYGWRSVFFYPALVVAAVGALVYIFLHTPWEVGLDIPGKDPEPVSKAGNTTSLKFWQLLGIKMLPELAATVFFVKIVRYCLLMWLPMYLFQELHYSKAQAGLLSTSFEIGGVLGSATLGVFIDKLFHGDSLQGVSTVIMFSTLSLILFLLTASWGIPFNVMCMLLTGMFNCGPDAILTGSLPTQLGDKDGRNAHAAISGFINGFGSVGTVLQGPIIGAIAEWYGWEGTFYFMIVVSLIATFCICRAVSTRQDLPGALVR
ncbi:PREDICTED: putative glycerol-3-phosphate transporter 5 [Branchiostoma belcheri]|uniref:Glycerol-3-phosphate transporter 5 n=1 Tax=Branchiostoma belcheri TaxID=7741 RepID=A0A6P4YUL4_BRABE|nr:PREDICTED: putative glycerol-3-phosphate transporter 5 [Branchiostoma belcheri]